MSAWKLTCPIHNKILKSEKFIDVVNEGQKNTYPVFFCPECGNCYFHADHYDYVINTNEFEGLKLINIENEPEIINDSIEISFNNIKTFDEPFVPVECYKDNLKLIHLNDANVKIDADEYTLTGYYCSNCHDFYIDSEVYDDIFNEYEVTFSNSYISKKNSGSIFEEISPSSCRKCFDEVKQHLYRFEACKENYQDDFPFSLLHYALVFRQFGEVYRILEELDEEELEKALHFRGESSNEWITPLVCAKWNLNYINAYDEKNDTHIYDRIKYYLSEVEYVDEIIEYTDIVDKDGKSVFDIFWHNMQPLLDVVYYEKQELASKQVEKNSFSIVIDEVGTGKTVSAFYAIQNIINKQHQINDKARILVVCPYNKREDWQNDIRRQLGRYAHVVEQGDNGKMYSEGLKKVYFKNSEDIIFIAGPKQGSDLDGSNTALKGDLLEFSDEQKWNLVIIDEGHISFKNYSCLDAEKAIILSATPIVVNSTERRTFDDYVNLLELITNNYENNNVIDPINKPVPDKDDVYVNWFKEDMGRKAAERQIRFVSCKRYQDRNEIFYKIKEEYGALAALQYDQDDEYLLYAAEERYGISDIKPLRRNYKTERLIELLNENEKSFIIFCEHQFVVNRIFQSIKNSFGNIVVAKKYGTAEDQIGLGNVQNGQLINTMMQALRNNKRVIFITTGKTGGTGLNLGEFDGIIHYELPFTSIELEQRFGRVDRIDTNVNSKNRDMIFMLNECKSDENDMEVNRMLYYCTTKIDITCQYMPIRNTVLYYPEFIKRNGKSIHDSLLHFKSEYVLSEANERIVKTYKKKRKNYENSITSSEYWNKINGFGKTVRECVLYILKKEKKDYITDSQYEFLMEYIEFLRETRSVRNEYDRTYKRFLEVKKSVNAWLSIAGKIKSSSDSDIFIGSASIEDKDIDSDNDSDYIENEINGLISEVNRNGPGKPVYQQIDELIKLIESCDFENSELDGFSSDGVFCFKDNSIKRLKVQDYRSGAEWM